VQRQEQHVHASQLRRLVSAVASPVRIMSSASSSGGSSGTSPRSSCRSAAASSTPVAVSTATTSCPPAQRLHDL
jgi:hypothetical protein